MNYGGRDCSPAQLEGWLETFYKQAAQLNFHIFVSFDTTLVSDPNTVVTLTNKYADHPAQLKISSKPVVSSFSVTPPLWNWKTDVFSKVKEPVLFLPGTLNQQPNVGYPMADGFPAFTWVHPTASVSGEQEIDTEFAKAQTANQPWMAGVAPWFFKRMGPDQNWLHAQDSGMWLDRWMNLLELKPSYIEIVTWNDVGESSYIGPSNTMTPAQLAAGQCYYGGLDHSAFLKMSKYFISAFKAGQTSITVDPKDEDVFMYYRLHPAETNGKKDTLPLPMNVTDIKDNVYVISFLANEASITVNSGGEQKTISYPTGVGKGTVVWNQGVQSLSMNRKLGNGETLSKTGPAIVAQMDRYQANVVAI